MKRLSSLMALVALLSFSGVPTLSFAGDPAPTEQKDKKDTAGPKLLGDDKKDDKKDKGGHVIFVDEKKDEKKEMGGK